MCTTCRRRQQRTDRREGEHHRQCNANASTSRSLPWSVVCPGCRRRIGNPQPAVEEWDDVATGLAGPGRHPWLHGSLVHPRCQSGLCDSAWVVRLVSCWTNIDPPIACSSLGFLAAPLHVHLPVSGTRSCQKAKRRSPLAILDEMSRAKHRPPKLCPGSRPRPFSSPGVAKALR